HVIDGDDKVLVDRRGRRGGTESLESEYYAIVSHPLVPRHRVRCLYCDSLDALRQNTVAISLVLPRKDLMAWHTDCTGSDSIGLEFLLRVEYQSYFRAAGNEHDLGRATWRISKNVGTASQSTCRGVLGSVNERELLTSQHERYRTFLVLECHSPGLRRFRGISGTNQGYFGNRAQCTQLLDRLV